MPNKVNARAVTNLSLAQMLLKIYPSFASHTASVTAKTFSEAGFEQMTQYDSTFVNDFYGLSMRVWLNIINMSHAKDPLAEADFGEYYDMPYGGIIQRMSIDSIKPISPGWKGLKDGDSPDPFVVRKPTTHERFYKQNFDYASLITVPDDFQMKQIFISEYGMSEYMAGIFEGLQNGYTVQVYLNKLEALNAAINSAKTPLKSTQKVAVTFADPANPTDAELKEFILKVLNTASAMTVGPQTGDFNAAGFKSTQDRSRLRLLVRLGYKNSLRVKTLVGAFNRDELGLDLEVVEVSDFGGRKPTVVSGATTTPVYPVYDSLGAVKGYNSNEDGTGTSYTEDEITWSDPNADVYAVLADKGVIFECRQNPYTTEPIRNPRGRYTNYWASSPNNTIAYDANYNLVVFSTGA